MPDGAGPGGGVLFSTVGRNADAAGGAVIGELGLLAVGLASVAAGLDRIVAATTASTTATAATATQVHGDRRRDGAALPCVACRLAFPDRLLSLRPL